MTKILIAIAALMVAAVATAAPTSADCIRLTDDPASPCREVQGIDEPVVNYAVAIDGNQCVVSVEWTNPPSVAGNYALTLRWAQNKGGENYRGLNKRHTLRSKAYSLTSAYETATADVDMYNTIGIDTNGVYTEVFGHRIVEATTPGFRTEWQANTYHNQVWRRHKYEYTLHEAFPFKGWYIDQFQAALFDCAQELEDKLDREDEAARVAAEQRAIAVEARERELELNRRLLIQVNDLKLAQERLASEVKLQEKETRITAEIVALQKRLIETRIATQEAILSGLERRAEIIRTGALERNEIMQEFLLQSGSRYEDIETKQAETAAVLRELRAGFAETQRRNEQALAAQEALLFEAEQQEAEISAELADKEAELESAAADE